MEKLKERITENGIDYILVGDYYIPDLKLPEEDRPIGHYGRLHREYLKQEHPAWYSSLILTRINRKSLFCSSPFCVILKKKGDFYYVTYR